MCCPRNSASNGKPGAIFGIGCGLVCSLAILESSRAAGIILESSSVSVVGRAGNTTYSGSNAGQAAGFNTESTWSATSSGTMTSSGATLDSQCRLVSGFGEDWISNSAAATVTVTCVFQPILTSLTFKFTGSTGMHFFESYSNYSLRNLNTNILMDEVRWSTDQPYSNFSGWGNWKPQPYTTTYSNLNLDHRYELTLLSQSQIGDFRNGWSNLQLVIVPEPSSIMLLSLGATGLLLHRRRALTVYD